ncbi:MAG: histidine phosphatase family protein [Muribaculaceae bacterium]|nr:histidine phosphatase family protein [Muribaculaceae bacterium]
MYFHRKCKITFVCHGATIYSEEGRFSDAQNYPPLSESGIEEMESLAKYFKARGVKNDAIYASPSVRTAQSAMMIAKMFKKDYETLDELTSRKFGKWSGLTVENLLNKYPDFTNLLLTPNETMGDAESSTEFISRVKTVIEKLVEDNIGNRIIIVTHPEVIQAAICAALDIPADKLSKIFIRTGSATQISYFDDWASLVYSDHTPL